MNIKKGDKVKITAGKDKGKTGKVLQVFPSENLSRAKSRSRVSIEGLNLLIKHLRPRRQGEQGQRIEFPAAIDSSNLMLICSRCGKPTGVRYKIIKSENNKKVKKFRECKKCKQTID